VREEKERDRGWGETEREGEAGRERGRKGVDQERGNR
jgi:hypothetical protein